MYGSIDQPVGGGRSRWGYYLKRWYLFAVSLLVFLGAGYYYLTYLVVPEYRVSSTLLLRDKENGSGPQLPAAFGELNLFQPVSQVEDEIEILRSDSLMFQSLQAIGHGVHYSVGGREVYGRQLPFFVDVDRDATLHYDQPIALEVLTTDEFRLRPEGEAAAAEPWETYRFGDRIAKPYGTFTVIKRPGGGQRAVQQVTFSFLDFNELRDEYSLRFDVSQVNIKSNVITLGLIDHSAERAVDLLNLIIEGYKQDALVEKHQLALNTIDLIDRRLASLTEELSEVEGNVESYKRNRQLTDVASEAEVYLERANDYSKQLGSYQLRIDVLNSTEKYLNNDEGGFTSVPSSLSIDDPNFTGLVTQYNELLQERQELLATSKAKNPLVVNLEKQLTGLQSRIKENIRTTRNGLTVAQDNLRANAQRFERQIRQVPSIERDLVDIQRQQGIKNNLYLYLLQKREEAALSLAAGVPSVRVISPPRVAPDPVQSKKSIVYVSSLLFGLFLPFALLNLRRSIRDKVEEPSDLSEWLSVPTLSTIGHYAGKGERAVGETASTGVVAELFTLMLYDIQFAYAKPPQVILVTSSKAGEGKTFISRNLAASYAVTGKRTLRVNLDLRKAQRKKPAADRKGIVDYLLSRQDVPVMDFVREVSETEGLFTLEIGTPATHPAQLLRSPRLPQLIAALRQEFDHIVIDTSPVGLVSDPLALSRLVDVTLYVVRAGVTQREELRAVQEIADKQKLPRLMIVLNDYRGAALRYGYGSA